MRKTLAPVLSILALLVSATVFGHGGHEHTMGTVAAVDAKHLEVKRPDGKTVSIRVTPDTKYVKGKAAMTFADVVVGTRVMVESKRDKGQLVAHEVQIGAGSHQGNSNH